MKTKAKMFSSFLLLSLIIMTPLTVRAKSAAPMYWSALASLKDEIVARLRHKEEKKCFGT